MNLVVTEWWQKFLTLWQQHDVVVSITAERDADGTALIIDWGTRTQICEMTNATAERLGRQLAGEITNPCGEPQVAIIALATTEIARIEEAHAVRIADIDSGE